MVWVSWGVQVVPSGEVAAVPPVPTARYWKPLQMTARQNCGDGVPRSGYAPWPCRDLSGQDLSGHDLSRQDLPDPSQFIDTSVKKTASMSEPSGSHTRRKRASSPGRIAR